jgi:preprotein translocase subunit SecG
MTGVLIIIHLVVCLVLIMVVLMQSSKGGGLAGAFGGGGGMPQQIFGTRGMTTLLHKLTIYAAVGFFLTSALLFIITARHPGEQSSVVREAVSSGELGGGTTMPSGTQDFSVPPVAGEQQQAPAASPEAPPAGQPTGGGEQQKDQAGGGSPSP